MKKSVATAILFVAAVIGMSVLPSLPSDANPITYTDQFTATGTLGSTAFTNEAIVLELVGDISNAHATGVGLYNNVGTVTVTIAGLGTATLKFDSFGVAANTNIDFFGFSDFTINHLIVGFDNAALSSYELTNSVGPVTGPGIIDSGFGFATSAGTFVLTQIGDVTLTADADVPEPPTGLVFGAALALLAAVPRRTRTVRRC